VSSNGPTTLFNQTSVIAGESLIQSALASKSMDYFGTVRGRIGFLATPTLLVYGTGGLAYGGIHSSTLIGQAITGAPAVPNIYSAFGSVSNTRVGWTAGGGVEWLFLPNWSIKLEYLYYDLGSVTYGLSPLANFNTGGTLFTLGLLSREPTSMAISFAPASIITSTGVRRRSLPDTEPAAVLSGKREPGPCGRVFSWRRAG
jgi:outer membrane immunogenic protein